ncbi:hypothetical protein B0A55_01985 [Friedmanniomyces simplex]|uniref:Uncharacterized protein n=1 Tax=Friedmanniomyces simplex TaxID=329884 RepID=A0A4U0XSZ1_9PEZI|nr:hypothetical protein B0A55_01985 [Friedmanniomyces simplex]
MGKYDLIRPAKALGSSTHARTRCDSVPSPEPEEWSDTDSQASYGSAMTRSLEMPHRRASTTNPQRVNSMSFLPPYGPEATNSSTEPTPSTAMPRRTIFLEPVRSTQRGHHPIPRRPTPHADELRATLFEAIERCTGVSERAIDGALAASAWFNALDDDLDEDEWVMVELADGKEQWEMVGAEGEQAYACL